MSLHFARFDLASRNWDEDLSRLPGGLVCQTRAWLAFLERSQGGDPVAALLMRDREVVGAFAGMIVRKLGMRILGSPFPGWTTPYMGLSLAPGVSRPEAMGALVDFAFNDLGVVHLEVMDRSMSMSDVRGLGARHRMFNTSEVDLGDDPESLILTFSATCRRYIHKGERDGLVVEQARDTRFVDDYYGQLVDVFARQRLVPTYPKSRVRQLIGAIPEDQVLLLRVRTSDGQSAASAIFHAVDRQRAYLWGIAGWRSLAHLHPYEILMFHAMNQWRERGFTIMDLGGSGEYKQKYHPRPTPVPWVRISRYPFIPPLREAARGLVLARQRVLGMMQSRAGRAAS